MSGSHASPFDGQHRLALVASATDFRLIDELRTEPTGESIGFDTFRAFALEVWRSEGHAEPLLVSVANAAGLRHRIPPAFRDQAAWALWCYPGGGVDCTPDIGPRFGELEGTSGPVAYVDVTTEGLRRLIVLHELAHLAVDDVNVHLGHGEEWISAHGAMISTYLGDAVANRWQTVYELAESTCRP
jgi:hypothetical protein